MAKWLSIIGRGIGKGELKLELARREEIIREEAAIKSVLPHRDNMLLLDRVVAVGGRITGYLEVTPARCIGFCRDSPDNLVLRGVDFVEMAAQLLGIYGSLIPEIARMRRRFVLAEAGVAKFYESVKAGETIEMEIPIDNIRIRKGSGDQYALLGRKFIASVNGDKRAAIRSILLISVPIKGEQLTRFEKYALKKQKA